MGTGPPFDLSVTDELLTTTRSVRRRLDLTRTVAPQLVLECIDVAQQAPTGGNSQQWHFVVVTDPRKRARLADLYREAGMDYLTRAREAAQDPQTQRVYDSALYLAEILARVPVHVIPCLRSSPPTTGLAAAGYYASIMPAIWNFMLAARSRGLGTVWTTLTLARTAEVAALLGIPDDVTQVALIPVAHYTGETFRPAARPAPETITSWNSWLSPPPYPV